MNDQLSTFSADDEKRFDELLPWYVNGTLNEADRCWMESMAKLSPAAAGRLADMDAFGEAVRALAQPIQKPSAPAPRWTRFLQPALEGFTQWLARPQWAMAMAGVVVVQSALIGWMAVSHDSMSLDADSPYKSVPAHEARTLRVMFIPSASEMQIRAALTGAGARIVGGPTQLGIYWITSSTLTLDELKSSLLKSGLVDSLEVDRTGPQGQ